MNRDIDSPDYRDHNLGDPRETPDEKEIARLERELTALRAENAELRKKLGRALRGCCTGNTDDSEPVRCQSYEASEQNAPCPRGRCVMAEEESAAKEAPVDGGVAACIRALLAFDPGNSTPAVSLLSRLARERDEAQTIAINKDSDLDAMRYERIQAREAWQEGITMWKERTEAAECERDGLREALLWFSRRFSGLQIPDDVQKVIDEAKDASRKAGQEGG